MIDLDALARQAKTTSEWGRARMAVRVGAAVAALTLASVAGSTEPRSCAVGGGVLLVVATALRWWHQRGVEAVRVGLPLGIIPLVVGIVLQRAGVRCGPFPSLSASDVACAVAGGVAGMGVTAWTARTRADRWRRWPLALLVASLTAMLGCYGLGAVGLLATLAPLAMSSAIAWIPLAASER
jgi:hypothetical protein